jgi:hypothetical protein
MTVACARQAARRMALAEPGQQEAPEHPTEHAHRQEEGGAARQPLGALWRQPAAGDHTVEMGMMMQGVAPGMQDREEAQVGAEMPRIAGDREEGFGHGLQQARLERARVLQPDRAEGMREREDHMEGGDVEECRCTGGQPRRVGAPLALGAMPVATGVLGPLGVVTVVALHLVASEGRRPAGRDGPQGPPLLGGDGPAIAGEIGVAIRPDHVRHCEGRAAQTSASRGQASSGLGVACRAWGVTGKERLGVRRLRWPSKRWLRRRSTPASRRGVAKV